MVDGAQFSVVLLSCGPGYASVQEGLYRLGLNHPDLEIERHVWPMQIWKTVKLKLLGSRSRTVLHTIRNLEHQPCEQQPSALGKPST